MRAIKLPTVHLVHSGRVQHSDPTDSTGTTTSGERERLSLDALPGDTRGLTCTAWTYGRIPGLRRASAEQFAETDAATLAL